MVDPNRKINRLTEKDIEFLDECEEEFAYRFTEQDDDFVKYCEQPPPEPPVVQNWCEHRPNRNPRYNNDYRSNRRWGDNNDRRGRFRPYDRNHHNRDHGGGPRRDTYNNTR